LGYYITSALSKAFPIRPLQLSRKSIPTTKVDYKLSIEAVEYMDLYKIELQFIER